LFLPPLISTSSCNPSLPPSFFFSVLINSYNISDFLPQYSDLLISAYTYRTASYDERDMIQGSFHVHRSPDVSSLDPTAGIVFTPSLNSDELFFALKEAFPDGVSHGDRLRSALIDFLVSEQMVERRKLGLLTPESLTLGRPRGGRLESEFLEMGGVKFEKRRAFNESAGALNMDSEEGKARARKWRRTMTVDEKKEYRARRERGACGPCKKRKRKCTHDQETPEMEEVEGYEGDCEVGSTPLEGLPEEKEVATAKKDTISLISKTKTASSVSETPVLNFATSEVEAAAWSIPPWPSSFEDVDFDITDTSGFDESMGLWPMPLDFSLEELTIPQTWTQQTYRTHTDTATLVHPTCPRIDLVGALLDHNDFEDETYQSCEEVEKWEKVEH
jgi:hypothetical protein